MKQQDLLKSQTSVDEQDNLNSGNDELKVEKTQMEGTPFWIIGNAYKGWMLVLGNHQITPIFKNVPELKEHIVTNKWDIIVTLCMVSADWKYKELKEKEEIEKSKQAVLDEN